MVEIEKEEETKEREREFAKIVGAAEPPLVSILVLCYKNTALLRGMLKSIFDQDYPRIQLIVSDDASDDFDENEILEYIEEEKDVNIERVLVRRNTENLGTVKHVSQALIAAEGEYIVLTAADDRFNNTMALSTCVRRFLEEPEAQWLVAKCNLLTPDYAKSVGTAPANSDIPFFESDDAAKLYSRWSRKGLAIPCSMMFRNTAIPLVGGIDLSYTYLEDWPLVLKLLRNGYKPLFLNRIISVHSTGGVTNSNDRYGVATRKAFYQDKYHLMETEVLPHKDLLSQEDQTKLKIYLKEIMERNHFLDIICEELSFKDKLKQMFKSPTKFMWLVERKYDALKKRISHKLWLIVTQGLLLSGALLMACGSVAHNSAISILGCAEVIIAAVSACGFLCSAILKIYCHLKAGKRRELVM